MIRCGEKAFTDLIAELVKAADGSGMAKLEYAGQPFCFDPALEPEQMIVAEKQQIVIESNGRTS